MSAEMRESKKSRLFLTGIRGRLAQALLAPLSETWDVTGVSREPQPSAIGWSEFLEDVNLRPSDVVMHLAWSVLPLTAQQDPGRSRRQDVPLLEKLLARMAKAGSEAPLLVFFSTCAVYGNAGTSPHTEDDSVAPLGEYARSKAEAESMIQDWASRTGAPAAVLRIANIYGFPHNNGKPQGVFSHLLAAASSGRAFDLWGGDTGKDYLHIDDLVRALRCLAGRRMTGLWNVCSGQSTRLLELVALAERVSGCAIQVNQRAPMGDMHWDVSQTNLSREKLSRVCAFEPTITVEEGMRRLWASVK